MSDELDVKRLITIPALIALGVTLVRLVGELRGGPQQLFNRAPGGAGALIGIVWLIPIFGAYFAVRLMGSGRRPGSPGKVIGLAVLAFVAFGAISGAVIGLSGSPNVPGAVSPAGVFVQQLGMLLATGVALVIVRRGWPALFRTMLAYAFASRIPVVIVMLVAMIAGWGTHYEVGPPGYPEMSLPVKFVAIAVFPQLTFWVMGTVVLGMLFGGLTAAVRGREKAPA